MLTRKQRRDINRKNAARSTGPKSIEGKNRSRLNSLKHGLRAETILLPNENLEDLQDCFDDWDEHYGPDTPGERFLIHRAVYLGLQLNRCAVHQAALVSQQIRHALLDFDIRKRNEVEALKLLMIDDPNTAAHRLHDSAAGCAWLIRSFEFMARILREGRFWNHEEQSLARRLAGIDPTKPGVEDSEIGETMTAHEALCRPYAVEDEENTAEWAEFRAELLRLLDQEIVGLRPREAVMQAIEEEDRAQVVARTLLPEGPKAALYQRYERMYELSFQRVYKEILKAIQLAEKAEKEGLLDDEDGLPEVVGETGAPNEANRVSGGQLSSSETKVSESGSDQNRVPDSMTSGESEGSGGASAG